MRRPPIACRRAVQSLHPPSAQHIWVSDELLSSTFNRFFRDSCPHQRRHGSHVPGPLEARRRAAKRRMTVSANFYPQDSFPLSFSLGALFGLRSSPQPSWKYEPPSLRKDRDNLDSEAPLEHGKEYNTAAWEIPDTITHASSRSDNSPTVAETSTQTTSLISQNIAPALEEPAPTVQSQSRDDKNIGQKSTIVLSPRQWTVSFKHFQAALAQVGNLSDQSVRDCLKQSCSAYQPDAHNAWVFNVRACRHLLDLGFDPTAILEGHTARLSVPPVYSQHSMDFLMCLEDVLSKFPNRLHIVHQIHTRMAENAMHASISEETERCINIVHLVRRGWHTAQLQGLESTTAMKKLLLRLASKIGDQPSSRMLRAILKNDTLARGHVPTFLDHIADHPELLTIAARLLSCVPEEQLQEWVSWISLNLGKTAAFNTTLPKTKLRRRSHTWLQLLCTFDSMLLSRTSAAIDVALHSIAKYVCSEPKEIESRFQMLTGVLLVKAAHREAPSHNAEMQITKMLVTLDGILAQDESVSVGAEFDALRSVFRRYNLSHEPLVSLTFDLFSRHASFEGKLVLMRVLDRRKLVLADTTRFQYAIDERIAVLRARSKKVHVSEQARQHLAYQLQACQQIIDILSRVSSTPVFLTTTVTALQAQRQFDFILARAEDNKALPLAYRNLTADLTTQQRVNLIHQLAHQYATDNTRTQRQAWRAMYYLYKYLVTYSLPIGPLMSKAIVRVSIIRPFSESQFVSAKRLIWVCHIVARVEGEAVARKLEKAFWDWRGDLIKHAKSVYVSAGGHHQDKAHISTMKKLGLI
ncbi:hypothetical protein FB567DRAFT_511484 [Paraphoma chrysanthemicola]|uniref:Uncharacterized protein n=1 Tax=Paraphoma chrysanthemicola TaxID=798071 RepID=A0A8K0RJJ1_9PLEO|nr:hypothetical protein FB567DRAFT_511484 [Paraphoma chrysanthemicola]